MRLYSLRAGVRTALWADAMLTVLYTARKGWVSAILVTPHICDTNEVADLASRVDACVCATSALDAQNPAILLLDSCERLLYFLLHGWDRALAVLDLPASVGGALICQDCLEVVDAPSGVNCSTVTQAYARVLPADMELS